jgi:archaellum component FlaG (FlaF/FlaG flagellin family)
MKNIVNQINFVEDNLNKTLTTYDDNTGSLQYYYSPSKVNVIFNFPIHDDNEKINDNLIDILSTQYLKRIRGCL